MPSLQEFRNNFLPTTYITTIAKDLEYTSNFYSALLEIKPINSDGIDFVEQVVRFLKYYDKIKDKGFENNNNNNVSRIILGCNKDYKNIDLLYNLIKKNISSNEGITLDIPLFDMDNKTVKFMAIKFFPNDIMQYFMKSDI